MPGRQVELGRQRLRVHVLRRRLVEVLLRAVGLPLMKAELDLHVRLAARLRRAVDPEQHLQLAALRRTRRRVDGVTFSAPNTYGLSCCLSAASGAPAARAERARITLLVRDQVRQNDGTVSSC